jgi:hypothetical protein
VAVKLPFHLVFKMKWPDLNLFLLSWREGGGIPAKSDGKCDGRYYVGKGSIHHEKISTLVEEILAHIFFGASLNILTWRLR